jgi:hypothetical protein
MWQQTFFMTMLYIANTSIGITDSDTKISFYAPKDGGTPRSSERINRLSLNEFLIKAFVEEGKNPLTHAVSRLDLVCCNNGKQAETVTLHLDLSGDGIRTNFDDNMYGGMPLRDFIYIQPPKQAWSQVNGKTDGWICTVSFAAEPGETKIGLSPWYNYEDYHRLINSLPEYPYLRKEMIGLSDENREHWELTVTDPDVPMKNKRCVFIHAREHAYETFSSYSIEGLLDYLLSDFARDARGRFVFVIHPMTNVDGVADGYEYRVGYDYPDPRGTTSARLTYGAMDRLRPDYVVTWHNWIAPRNIDTIFYTDSQDGKATRRAWDIFTQRFPSPRAFDHRWESEDNPTRENWFGRSLSDDNVHQYAMKHYDSQVWGWEMPWWNRNTDDARRAGFDFAAAFLATLDELNANQHIDNSDIAVNDVPRWDMHEFELHGKSWTDNPFTQSAVIGEFMSPSGKKLIVEGFYDRDDTWRVRFAPDEEGDWHYLIRGEGVEVFQEGVLRCIPPKSKGFIHIHPDNPYAFAYDNGEPFFPMGDTCYGLYTDSPITPELRRQYLKIRRSQNFNFVRMGVVHSPNHWDKDSRFFPWGGTPQNPDLDRYNPEYFQGLDRVLGEMKSHGMNAELITLTFYQKPFTNTDVWTPKRERNWLRYITARYSAFSNIFLWTISNEYETHPDGSYRLDLPDDVEWAKATARFIKQHDPYKHLVTVHPVISASTHGNRPNDSYEKPWRIGEFFGQGDEMDVISQQTGQAGVWDEALQCWIGDDPYLVASLSSDRKYQKPVMNTENGYEFLRGYPNYSRQAHHTDKVRRSVWRIVCAGGYFAAGFGGTIGHSDFWNIIGPDNRYSFVIKDEGAPHQLSLLCDFFVNPPFWRMQPYDGIKGDAVAIAEVGEVYVIYMPKGGNIAVDLTQTKGDLTVRWFDPRHGEWTNIGIISGGMTQDFDAPDEYDWVLYIRSRGAHH